MTTTTMPAATPTELLDDARQLLERVMRLATLTRLLCSAETQLQSDLPEALEELNRAFDQVSVEALAWMQRAEAAAGATAVPA